MYHRNLQYFCFSVSAIVSSAFMYDELRTFPLSLRNPSDFPPCVCYCCNTHYNQSKLSSRLCTGQLKLHIRTAVEGRRISAPSKFTAEYVIRFLLILFQRAYTVVWKYLKVVMTITQ